MKENIEKLINKYENISQQLKEDINILSTYIGSASELIQKQAILNVIDKVIQDLKKLKG